MTTNKKTGDTLREKKSPITGLNRDESRCLDDNHTIFTIYENPYLSVRELSRRTGIKYQWLLDAVHFHSDTLPSRIRAKQARVLWSDFLAWDDRRYGLDGYLRGHESLEYDGVAS
jgi:hypothetical protein